MVIRLVILLLMLTGAAHADSLRLVVPEMQPVVSEMVPLTIRGEYSRQITLETLTFPNSDDYDWMQLARDQWRDEEVEGRTVRVFERRIAVFPRHAGALTLGPVEHHLTVMGRNNTREPLVIAAPPVTLAVAPFPATGAPLAARSLTVDDTVSAAPGALRDGETLIRRVTLKADGTLPQMLPARPSLREPWLITFAAPERRAMQPTPEGPVTTVSWEWHLRPKTGEPGVLPAVPIAWLDTATRQMRSTDIPAIPFGYASFGDNRSGAEHLPLAQFNIAVLAVGGGLAAGLAIVLAARPQRRRENLRRIIRRLSPHDPTLRTLKRVASTGDPIKMRRAAEANLRRRRDLGQPVTGRETAQLDEVLYSGEHKAPFDPSTTLRVLTHHR